MPQALISINGVPGSNDDLPINTLVQLANIGVGGEATYSWFILDQPTGAADTLSNAAIANPTFTPKKEGSYLIELVVNQGTGTEVRNRVIAAVRQLKSRGRVMASGEDTEVDPTIGWKAAGNDWLQKIDTMLADPGYVVAVAGAGGLAVGDILMPSGKTTIKAGLPGAEVVPVMTKALANVLANVSSVVLSLLGGVDGNPTPANGALIRCRIHGPRYGIATAGAPAAGDPVYVSDLGRPALVVGTNVRQIGRVFAAVAGVSFDYWHNGLNV